MNYRRLFFAIILGFFIAASAPIKADTPPQYTLVPLGFLPGYNSSCAYSINNQNQSVGSGANHGHDYQSGYFDISGNGNNYLLGSLGGRSFTKSINNQGRCVGYSFIDSYNDEDQHAVEFDVTGQSSPTHLGTLPGGFASSAEAINDNGLIVGYSNSENHYYSEATVFSTQGNYCLPIPQNLPGSYVSSWAACVNNDDQIGGTVTLDDLNRGYAILWNATPEGYTPIMLGGTASGDEGQVRSINDFGKTVGISGNVSSGQFCATLFDTTGNGNNLSLGTINGGNTSANCINNIGQIVGSEDSEIAILFDSTGGDNNHKLNDLVVNLNGWNLTEAQGINDNGWIVGVGINELGQREAYLLTPIPEPATLSLLALGGLALFRKRRA